MALFLFLGAFAAFSLVDQEVKLNDSDSVYVIPGDKFFHLRDCEKLGASFYATTYKMAQKKGLKPCPDCIPFIESTPSPKIGNDSDTIETTDENKVRTDMSVTSFRGINWGTSKAEVKRKETSEFMQEIEADNGLTVYVYSGKAGSLNCLIGYYFAKDQLVEGRYAFNETHTNNNLFISDFHEVDSSLKEKYGDPTDDTFHWKNDLYKDDREEYGLAISMGHLIIGSRWNFSSTKILHQLTGDNFEIKHSLAYKSKNHDELIEQVKKEKEKIIW